MNHWYCCLCVLEDPAALRPPSCDPHRAQNISKKIVDIRQNLCQQPVNPKGMVVFNSTISKPQPQPNRVGSAKRDRNQAADKGKASTQGQNVHKSTLASARMRDHSQLLLSRYDKEDQEYNYLPFQGCHMTGT